MQEDKYNGEQVLVFNASIIKEVKYFQGITCNFRPYLLKIAEDGICFFTNRAAAEQDTSLKQVISYTIILSEDGKQVFSYVRGKASGEGRLVGRRSIGVGGHINPIDGTSDIGKILVEGALRELNEEVLFVGTPRIKKVAIINDDLDAVGKVHFGLVNICTIKGDKVNRREDLIEKSGFSPINLLSGAKWNELEGWSKLALGVLKYDAEGEENDITKH